MTNRLIGSLGVLLIVAFLIVAFIGGVGLRLATKKDKQPPISNSLYIECEKHSVEMRIMLNTLYKNDSTLCGVNPKIRKMVKDIVNEKFYKDITIESK